MGRLLKVGLVVLAVFLLFYGLTHFAMPRGDVAFAKYIYSPVPKGVKDVRSEVKDWFGIMPEPVCYFRFSIEKADVERIVREKGFAVTRREDMFSPGGPPWFKPGLISTNGQFYRRKDQRRNTQYFWIDETGTNAFFLYWGV